jgi:hypothetical protein
VKVSCKLGLEYSHLQRRSQGCLACNRWWSGGCVRHLDIARPAVEVRVAGAVVGIVEGHLEVLDTQWRAMRMRGRQQYFGIIHQAVGVFGSRLLARKYRK